MGVNPNPFHRERADAHARNQRRESYEQALKEKKEQLAAEGLPWNSAEAERFDHEWRVAHIPLPDLSLNKPADRLLLILCILIPSLILYWACCDAFIKGNARSLILIAAFLLSFFFQGRLFIRLVFAARKAKKIGAEAWLHEESNRQKTKGIYPWNASEHAPWM